MVHITGSVYPHDIDLTFTDDEFGVITTHTCSREIIFPQALFQHDNEDSFKTFSTTLMAVIDSETFNIV